MRASDYGTWICPRCKRTLSRLANCRRVGDEIICINCYDEEAQCQK